MGYRITKFRIPRAGRQPVSTRAAIHPETAEKDGVAANDDGPVRVPSGKPRSLTVETWDINGAF